MHEKNPKSSRWLHPYFKEMVDRELQARAEARDSLTDFEEVVDDTDIPEDQYQCVQCKCYCYLTQVVATAAPQRATCPEHAQQVLGEVAKTMRLKYSDADLKVFLNRVKTRSDKMPRSSVGTAAVPEEYTNGEARKSGRKVC